MNQFTLTKRSLALLLALEVCDESIHTDKTQLSFVISPGGL